MGDSSSNNVTIVDDKSPICIPFILERLHEYETSSSSSLAVSEATARKPFIIGLNGVQGVGKTTLVQALATKLRCDEGLETLVCSLDDLYLTHADQRALAAAHPDNQLVQVRGEPGKFVCLFVYDLRPEFTHRRSHELIYVERKDVRVSPAIIC